MSYTTTRRTVGDLFAMLILGAVLGWLFSFKILSEKCGLPDPDAPREVVR